MQFRQFIIIFIFIIPCFSQAQETDITGLWKGTTYSDTTQRYYQYEVGISKNKGKYDGFSHVWYLVGDTQYFAVKKVTVKFAKDGKVVIEDDGVIAHNFPSPPNKGIRQLNILDLNDADSIMTLKGPFVTNRTKEYHRLTGSVNLQRRNDFWQSSLVPHLQELGKDDELSFVKEEKQALAKLDKQERDQQLAERSVAIKAEKEQLEKEKELQTGAKRAATEKDNEQKLLAKQEAAQKEKEQKELARQEVAIQQQEKKAATEKAQAEKLLAKQEQAKTAEEQKEKIKEIAAKEKEDRLLAKQAATEEKAQQKIAKANTNKKESNNQSIKPAETFKVNAVPAADVAIRKTIVQQTVNFSSDSLELSLYDNGEVDGDTVSVLMNGQLIIARQGLGVKAIKHTIQIPKNTNTVEMVMYAETLGSIPPNTGLLVIKDGKDLYEIRFSGDLQKNASIVLNRKKE